MTHPELATWESRNHRVVSLTIWIQSLHGIWNHAQRKFNEISLDTILSKLNKYANKLKHYEWFYSLLYQIFTHPHCKYSLSKILTLLRYTKIELHWWYAGRYRKRPPFCACSGQMDGCMGLGTSSDCQFELWARCERTYGRWLPYSPSHAGLTGMFSGRGQPWRHGDVTLVATGSDQN